MKHFCYLSVVLLLTGISLNAQRYLDPEEGYKVAYFAPEETTVRTFDVSALNFYFDDGLAIYQVDPFLGMATDTFVKPVDYSLVAFPGFLNLNPAGTEIWAGYTNAGNTDSRIYCIDVATGQWKLAATMPGNYDLECWGDSMLVSATNSTELTATNGIWVLDTTGSNVHRKIIETGGYSSGIAVDMSGNLYYGTSDLAGSNALYRWSNIQLGSLVSDPEAAVLGLADAEKLADLPMGANDIEVDVAGNVVFTMNVWGGESQVLGMWNGTAGDGSNYDTLATSASWLGTIKSRGNFSSPYLGNSLFLGSYGMAVADLHTVDYFPIVADSIPEITGYAGEALGPIDLNPYVIDLDDPEGMSFEVSYLSDENVATLSISEDTLLNGSFGTAGQANLQITATSAGQSVTATALVGTWPVLEGEYIISDFNQLSLEAESYWDGNDLSGSFSSGDAAFHNDYNTTYFSWSGWAYSNISDVSTAGFMNQYSAITGKGFGEDEQNSGIYAVSNLYGPAVIDFTDRRKFAPEGFFVTNATYAALSMEQGDFFAKQFGGVDGNDPDFFTLYVWGQKDGVATDSVEFKLADYTADTTIDDFIIKTWQWVDLSPMGKVDTLLFGLSSSDNSEYGMNTPAYFCLDDLYLNPDAAPFVENPISDFILRPLESDTTLDLSSVFSDPDDEDELITIALMDYSGYIDARLEGNQLIISGACPLKKTTSEPVELIIEGLSNGLVVRDTFIVTKECPGGIDTDESLTLHVWPNPGTGEFMVESADGGELELHVYSFTGKEVLAQTNFMPGSVLDLSNQPSGAYILKVRSSKGVNTIMIQKL